MSFYDKSNNNYDNYDYGESCGWGDQVKAFPNKDFKEGKVCAREVISGSWKANVCHSIHK